MNSIYNHIVLLSWLSFFSSCSAQKQPGKQGLESFIQSKVDSLQKKENWPGILVATLDNGVRNYYTAGYSDRDKKLLFDSATLFEIGSITKTFTGYVLMNVLMEKNISDTASILPYLPDSVQKNKALAAISFLNLMNHTSGLPRLPDNMSPANPLLPYDDYTDRALYDFLEKVTPNPSGKSEYSNLGAGLAGVLAERISGNPYMTLLDEIIFIPFNIGKAEKMIARASNKAQGHMENMKVEYWNMNVLAPAGGLKCSASEILTYLQHMSNPPGGNSKMIVDKMIHPTAAFSNGAPIGRYWLAEKLNNGSLIYWHNGGTFGFSTYASFARGTGKAVIVVVNKSNTNQRSDGLGQIILTRMLDEKE